MEAPRTQNGAAALAFAAILLWSSLAFLGSRLAALPPFLLVGLGMALGAALALPWRRHWFADLGGLALGTAGLFGYHFLLFSAFRAAPPVEANLINYAWPALIVAFSPLLLENHPLSARRAAGVLVSMLGVAWVATGGRWTFSLQYLRGYALALAAAFTWALYSVLTKRRGRTPTAAVGGFCLLSALLSLLAHRWLEPPTVLACKDWVWLAALGLGPMGAAFYAWDAALKRGDPRVIGSLSFLTPMLSTLILAFGGRFELRAPHFLAMALIVGGAALGGLPVRESPRR